jgi:hypothetical protein
MELVKFIENVQKLYTDELYEVREAIEKELSAKRLQEIEKALEEARKAASENKLKYYSTGEDFISSLNEE